MDFFTQITKKWKYLWCRIKEPDFNLTQHID